MTSLPPRRAARLSAATLFLLPCLLSPSPTAEAGGQDPFAGFSGDLLVPEQPYLFVNSVTLSNGYRNDHLEPGLGADELDLYELGLEADLHWGKLNVTGSAGFGWDSGADAGSLDLLAAVGYGIDLTVTGIRFTPLVGYAAFQLDRDARYDTEWEGPFAGARLDLPLSGKWFLQASYFYHWADFEAALAAAVPAGALTRADGAGHSGRLDLIYQVNERLDFELGAGIRSFSSGPASLSGSEADWESWNVRLGVSVKF